MRKPETIRLIGTDENELAKQVWKMFVTDIVGDDETPEKFLQAYSPDPGVFTTIEYAVNEHIMDYFLFFKYFTGEQGGQWGDLDFYLTLYLENHQR